MSNQHSKVLSLLQQHERLTQTQLKKMYKIGSPSKEVRRLREAGYPVLTVVRVDQKTKSRKMYYSLLDNMKNSDDIIARMVKAVTDLNMTSNKEESNPFSPLFSNPLLVVEKT